MIPSHYRVGTVQPFNCAEGGSMWRQRRTLSLIVLPLLFGVGTSNLAVHGSDWQCFRGPYKNGVAKFSEHPVEWGEQKNVAWKQKIEGIGWSQPIVCKDRVYLTTAVTDNQPRPRTGESGARFSNVSAEEFSASFPDGGTPPEADYQWKLICLDLKSGERLWDKVIHSGRPAIPIHRSNSYASETPICDTRQIYVYIAMSGLYCFDMDGKEVWKKTMPAHAMQYGWGSGSSAMLFCNTLYVQCDNEQKSFLLAIDRRTGEELWRVERDERSNWSTPYLWQNRDRRELITCGGNWFRSYDLRAGKVLWELPADGRSIASAVGDHQMLYLSSVTRSSGSRGSLTAIRPGAAGRLSLTNVGEESHIAWTVRRAAPELASPLLYKNRLYTFSRFGGIVSCFDAQTGELHFRERLAGAGGFTASPWAAKTNIFCLDETGKSFAISAGKSEFRITGTNSLDGMFWSSPAVTSDALLLRSSDHLYRIAANPGTQETAPQPDE